mgnify:CR=1 FL=1
MGGRNRGVEIRGQLIVVGDRTFNVVQYTVVVLVHVDGHYQIPATSNLQLPFSSVKSSTVPSP